MTEPPAGQDDGSNEPQFCNLGADDGSAPNFAQDTPLDDDTSFECDHCGAFNETGEICKACKTEFNAHDVIPLDDLIQEDIHQVPPPVAAAVPAAAAAAGVAAAATGPELLPSRAALLVAAAQDVFNYMDSHGQRDQHFKAMTDVLIKLGLIVDEVQALLGLTDSQATDALKRGIKDLLLVHLQPGIDGRGGDDGGGDEGGGDGGDGNDGDDGDGVDDVNHRDQRARFA